MPSRTPVWLVVAWLVMARARPKSATLTSPSRRTMTFSGLTSRWIMPAACAARSASRIGSRMASDSRAVSGDSSWMTSRRVLPSMSSIARKTSPCVLPLVEDGHDVGVVEAGGGPGLGAEPLDEDGVGGQARPHDLQGHLPVQAPVQRHVDGGHASVCEVGEDAVPAVDHPTDEGVRHAGRHGGQFTGRRSASRAGQPRRAARAGRVPAVALLRGGRRWRARWPRSASCPRTCPWCGPSRCPGSSRRWPARASRRWPGGPG